MLQVQTRWRKNSPYAWGRTPLVIAESEDGIRFGEYAVLEEDPERGFCYPSMYFLSADKILLAYCSGGREDGACLNRVTLRKLTVAP